MFIGCVWEFGAKVRTATGMIENPLGFYGDLLPIMQETDLAVVNLECVLVDDNLQLRQGTSILHNWFDPPTYGELCLTALRRVMDGKLGHAPSWASKSLIDWKVFWMNGK